MLASGAKAVAAGGAKQALLGSDPDPAGGHVVTYNHWPLYLYLGDSKPGVAYGQALNLNGGLWYVLSPSGALIKHKPHKGGGLDHHHHEHGHDHHLVEHDPDAVLRR